MGETCGKYYPLYPQGDLWVIILNNKHCRLRDVEQLAQECKIQNWDLNIFLYGSQVFVSSNML